MHLVAKMLASTMQISNNNPTNTLTHQQAHSGKGRNQKNKPPGPPKGTKSLILQDPTVCLTPSPTNVRQQVLRHHPTTQRAAGRHSVDDSTSEHHHRASNS
jgi:hypothetical protein